MTAHGRERRVSILLRTLDEAHYLPELLRAVRAQQCDAEIEWVLVDSGSTDATVDIAQGFGMEHILTLRQEEFTFGRALNAAAERASGEILVALSAHACPAHEHWLAFLLRHFDSPQVGGVYGRQLPRRDAWLPVVIDYERCYGPESVVHESVAGVCFSNANAALRRCLWEGFPFDERLPACEDQAWARQVVGAGYRIVYDAQAAVCHSHNESPRVTYLRRAREALGWRMIDGATQGGPTAFVEEWWSSSRADIHHVLRARRHWRWLLLSPAYRFFWALGHSHPRLRVGR